MEKEISLLEELKAKYGKVYTLEVPLDEDDVNKKAIIYLRKPDKTTRAMVSKLASSGKYDAAVEATLKNLYVGGDKLELILQNDDAMASCDETIVELLNVQKATLKKN
jgi:hypothetical protein